MALSFSFSRFTLKERNVFSCNNSFPAKREKTLVSFQCFSPLTVGRETPIFLNDISLICRRTRRIFEEKCLSMLMLIRSNVGCFRKHGKCDILFYLLFPKIMINFADMHITLYLFCFTVRVFNELHTYDSYY